MLALFLAAPATAEDRPGDFDFYVLSLSWSPSFCLTEAGRRERLQCDIVRHGFVVHGLWPQYEEGWPEFCATEEPPEVPASLAESMLDIMPSPGLIAHQWRKHGTCSGLDQAEYFGKTRRALERVSIPQELERPDRQRHLSARAVEEAFVAANPGLSPRGMAVACEAGRLKEVRICLTRNLDFRRCEEVDRRGCTDRRLAVPAHR